MDNNYLLLGPYFGDFKQEIYSFLPYIKWVSNVVPHKKIIVSSHFNRDFLYNWADEIIPIDPMITIDELNQKGFIYKSLGKTDFLKKIKELKLDLCNKYGIGKKQIKNYTLNYLKTKTYCLYYQLKFESLPYEKKESKIVFIPDRIEKEKRLYEIYKYLKDLYGNEVILLGDKKTRLQEDNNLLKSDHYHSSCYYDIINYISNAKMVICPASHWTFIANLQQVPVFSWGKFISQYKPNGIYHNNNNKCKVIYSDSHLNIDKIKNQIDWSLKNA